MSEIKKESPYALFAQRIGLVGIVNLLIYLNSIILLPILTKHIPIEGYGVWIQIIATVGLISSVALLGLPYSMIRFLAAAKDKADIQEGFYSIFLLVLFSGSIVFSFLWMLSRPLAEILFDGQAEIVRITAAIAFMVGLNELMINFFRTFQQIKRYSLYMILRTALNMVFVAYLVLSGYGLKGAVLGYLGAELFIFILMMSNIIWLIGIRIPQLIHIREYLSFGVFTIPTGLSNWVVNSSDRYVIGVLLGMAFVGYYSPGYTLGNIVNMLIAPFSLLLPAVLSNYYDNNDINLVKTLLSQSMKYFLALAIPSVFGLSLLSKSILTLLSTPQIAQEGHVVTPFIALSILLFGAYAIVSHVILLEKRTRILSMIWLVAAAVKFGLSFIFIPYLGLMGAALTTLLAYALAFAVTWHYSIKYINFAVDYIFMLKCIIASVIMTLAIFNWNPVDKISILLAVVAGFFIYLLVLFALGGLKKEDVSFFKGLFNA
jgi:O-antigen/teichoic acid export membrane protein